MSVLKRELTEPDRRKMSALRFGTMKAAPKRWVGKVGLARVSARRRRIGTARPTLTTRVSNTLLPYPPASAKFIVRKRTIRRRRLRGREQSQEQQRASVSLLELTITQSPRKR